MHVKKFSVHCHVLISPLYGIGEEVAKPVSRSGRRKVCCDVSSHSHFRLVRKAASGFMCSRKGHILNFFQQWAYKLPTWKGRQSGTNGDLIAINTKLTLPQVASIHATLIPRIFNQRYSLGSIHQGLAFERHVMTHRHFHASRFRRETDSNTGRTNGPPESRQRTTAALCNRYTDHHLCRPTSAVVQQPSSEHSLAGFRTNAVVRVSRIARGNYSQPWRRACTGPTGTRSCIGHKHMSKTVFKRKRACAFFTGTCVKHFSDDFHKHMSDTLQTQTCLFIHHKRIYEVLCYAEL